MSDYTKESLIDLVNLKMRQASLEQWIELATLLAALEGWIKPGIIE
jgi:hypothetical protein